MQKIKYKTKVEIQNLMRFSANLKLAAILWGNLHGYGKHWNSYNFVEHNNSLPVQLYVFFSVPTMVKPKTCLLYKNLGDLNKFEVCGHFCEFILLRIRKKLMVTDL